MMRMVIYVALIGLWFELANSRTSTLWKLNKECGKIMSGHVCSKRSDAVAVGDSATVAAILEESVSLDFDASADVYAQDEVFYIIASTLNEGGANGGSYSWVRQSPENSLETINDAINTKNVNSTKNYKNECTKKASAASSSPLTSGIDTALVIDDELNCGKPVNFTYYDYLIGISQRFTHPKVPEPEVAYMFLRTKDENTFKNFDITALERRLKRAKREKPRTVHLYNQIGNYFRIKGDSRQSIECFRRALAMSPTNAEVLLNMARVLYNLQYLDDAIHLTRRSLELQPPDRSAWQQYFTLGQIFKAYGHFQESILHLRHALELHPHHEPILKALRAIEGSPSSALHVHTIFIIIALVVAVFIVVITSSSNSGETCTSDNIAGTAQSDYEPRTQRHFNRAMAMRSLKGLSTTSSRNFRHRKK